ncbi:alfa-L-rhamnosidase [Penicillium sp. IBT 16267x]|nr:alfa-L-rhamnosidase [Penicillium sp. IBT 16267x]
MRFGECEVTSCQSRRIALSVTSERLGWTGDIQVFCPSASYLYHTAGILGDLLKDLACEQEKGGGVLPMIVPDVCLTKPARPPQAVRGLTKDVVAGRMACGQIGYGSTETGWTPPLHRMTLETARQTGSSLQMHILYTVLTVMSKVAAILDQEEDMQRYKSDYLRLKALFQWKYITPAGYVACDTQTAISLAIVFQLFENSE